MVNGQTQGMRDGGQVLRGTLAVALLVGFLLGAPAPVVRAAVTVTVNTTTDPTPSATGCDAATPGVCSLRDAVIYANEHADTTIMLAAGTYTLTIGPVSPDDARTGDLNLTNTTGTTTIVGVGTGSTLIDASGMTPTRDRVFSVNTGVTASMSGVTIQGGQAVPDVSTNYTGGGINNKGSLTLTNSTVTANNANGGGGGRGGGIYNFGPLTLNGSTVSNNHADFGIGGGIFNGDGFTRPTLIIMNSTITGNSTSTNGAGGGIYNTGPLTITGSTVGGGGQTSGTGGGIYNGNTASLTLTSSTVGPNGNSGIYNYFNGQITATNSTVGGNLVALEINRSGANIALTHATIGASPFGVGLHVGTSGTITVRNTIISSCQNGTVTSADYNLDGGSNCGLNQTHDISNMDPQLGPLQINAPGTTATQALGARSPALNKIPATGANCTATDQRGVSRPQPAGGLCDIGAYELQATSPAPTLAKVAPPSGPPAGNTSVTITGTGFQPGAAVTFDGLDATNVVVVNSTTITATTPAHPAGAVTVIVYNPDGQNATLPNGYSYGTVGMPTVTVTTTADGVHKPGCAADGVTAPCTLRDAVIYANGFVGPTTITLAAGTYTLTIGPSGNDDATTGDLNLAANTIINGAGAGTTIIDGSGMSPGDRVMKVGTFGFAGPTVTMTGVTIQGGGTSNFGSGGILNEGILTLTNSAVSNNAGSGINNEGTLTLNMTAITGNNSGGQNPLSAIVSSGLLTINGGTLSNNHGAGLEVDGGTAHVTGATISNNTGLGGGGIQVYGGSSVTLTTTTVSNNTSGIPGNGPGGGIYISGGSVTLNSSTVSNNTAQSTGGGGIVNGGSGNVLTLNNSTVSGNTVTGGEGGGIINGDQFTHPTLVMTNSTISGNTAISDPNHGGGDGGGLSNSGTARLTNSTISGNTATAGGGFGGHGGGIENNSGSLALKNVTVANNSTGIDGSGTLQNTLLANTGANCTGAFISNDYNLSTDTSCNAALNQSHDLNNTPATLGPLADNGGATTPHTFTHALLPGSAAINKIPNTGGCNGAGVTTDQRGIARPQPTVGLCDIGAFEVQASVAAPTVTGINPTSGPVGGGSRVTITGTGFQSGLTVRFGGPTGPAATIVSVSSMQIVLTTPAQAAGTVDVVVTNPDGGTVTRAGVYTYGVLNPEPPLRSGPPPSGGPPSAGPQARPGPPPSGGPPPAPAPSPHI